MEVKTNAALENDGVEYFCGNSHTALLTFAEPLTGITVIIFSLIPSTLFQTCILLIYIYITNIHV